MNAPVRIYGDLRSGNCLKVKYAADLLGVPHEWIAVDIAAGETRTPAFLAMNPAGQIPLVAWPDGRVLAQSNAIIRYLARGTTLLPADPFLQAKIDAWLFWEQYSHEPNVAVARFEMVYLGKPKAERDPRLVTRGEAALDLMEAHLASRLWLEGGGFTIADLALLAYTRLAPEGGFDLSPRPALRAWIARCEQAIGLES